LFDAAALPETSPLSLHDALPISLIAMTRIGIDAFWAAPNPKVPQVSVLEIAPVGALLALCIALTVLGGPVMRYMEDTAQALHARSEEHTSELQSRENLVCRLLLE